MKDDGDACNTDVLIEVNNKAHGVVQHVTCTCWSSRVYCTCDTGHQVCKKM